MPWGATWEISLFVKFGCQSLKDNHTSDHARVRNRSTVVRARTSNVNSRSVPRRPGSEDEGEKEREREREDKEIIVSCHYYNKQKKGI